MKTEEQQEEYTKCANILSKILNKNFKDFKCMSHPCGSYNSETLEILRSLGIELGFKEVMDIEKERGMTKVNNSDLEIARRDHAVIIREMRKMKYSQQKQTKKFLNKMQKIGLLNQTLK